jgi:hypothetical protein
LTFYIHGRTQMSPNYLSVVHVINDNVNLKLLFNIRGVCRVYLNAVHQILTLILGMSFSFIDTEEERILFSAFLFRHVSKMSDESRNVCCY